MILARFPLQNDANPCSFGILTKQSAIPLYRCSTAIVDCEFCSCKDTHFNSALIPSRIHVVRKNSLVSRFEMLPPYHSNISNHTHLKNELNPLNGGDHSLRDRSRHGSREEILRNYGKWGLKIDNLMKICKKWVKMVPC